MIKEEKAALKRLVETLQDALAFIAVRSDKVRQYGKQCLSAARELKTTPSFEATWNMRNNLFYMTEELEDLKNLAQRTIKECDAVRSEVAEQFPYEWESCEMPY